MAETPPMHESGSDGRVQKILLARALKEQGLNATEIGKRLGVSASTVRNWYLGGECEACGVPIEGSNARKARLCSPCRHEWEAREMRIWTREKVIDAIRRFAVLYGHPPQASDWNQSDREHGFPAKSLCYRNPGSPNAPFEKWADAIEAAGFPRPLVGKYERTPEVRERSRLGALRRWERERTVA